MWFKFLILAVAPVACTALVAQLVLNRPLSELTALKNTTAYGESLRSLLKQTHRAGAKLMVYATTKDAALLKDYDRAVAQLTTDSQQAQKLLYVEVVDTNKIAEDTKSVLTALAELKKEAQKTAPESAGFTNASENWMETSGNLQSTLTTEYVTALISTPMICLGMGSAMGAIVWVLLFTIFSLSCFIRGRVARANVRALQNNQSLTSNPSLFSGPKGIAVAAVIAGMGAAIPLFVFVGVSSITSQVVVFIGSVAAAAAALAAVGMVWGDDIEAIDRTIRQTAGASTPEN